MKRLGISVVGLGRAGLARCRSIQQSDDCSILSTYSRREDSHKKWSEILLDPLVDAVLICTENASHAEFIEAALQANKHVAVEFPLVNQLSRAEELYALAESKNLVLHCEFIGLLTSQHKNRKKMLQKNSWREIHCCFQGGINRWIQEEIFTGNYAQLSIGRLQSLWDLSGPLHLLEAELQKEEQGYTLNVICSTKEGRKVRLEEKRYPDRKRMYTWNILYDTPPLNENDFEKEGESLFLQDLRWFTAQIRGENKGYVSIQECLSVLRLAEQINRTVGIVY